jgi:3-aminobutyryl-CoA ammonia-lyase
MEGVIRVRMSVADVHYGGGIVAGARVLQLFGDALTEALIRQDGDEGLERTMNAEFLSRCGREIFSRSRRSCSPSVVLSPVRDHRLPCIQLVSTDDSAADVLPVPELVARRAVSVWFPSPSSGAPGREPSRGVAGGREGGADRCHGPPAFAGRE